MIGIIGFLSVISNGLIIQWVHVEYETSTYGFMTVSYPISFPVTKPTTVMGLHSEYEGTSDIRKLCFSYAHESNLITYVDNNLRIKHFLLIGF